MKKLIKKTMLIGMSIILILCFSACSKKSDENPADESASSSAKVNIEDVDTSAASDAETVVLEEKDATEDEADKANDADEIADDISGQADVSSDTLKENQTPEIEIPTETEVSAPTIEQAMAYIGQSAWALASSIGQPSSKSYATSCIGEGDDGEWYYDGFTVYTYRDTNGNETIEDVFAN